MLDHTRRGFAVLRAVMTRRQKITLIFPDRYLKFLETDDKRYLKRE